MEDFSRGEGVIAVLGEVFRQRHDVLRLRGVLQVLPIAVDASRSRLLAGQDGRTARAADRGGTIGLVQDDTFFLSQLVHVRGDGLRVASHASHPVVHVVDGDEQDVVALALIFGDLLPGVISGDQGARSGDQQDAQ